MLSQKQFCHLCLEKRLSNRRRRAGVIYCATCDETVPDRTEVVVRKLLLAELGPDCIPSAADNTMIGGCGFGRYRPDLAFVMTDRVIIIEIDENGGHPEYASTCESKRMANIAESIHITNGVLPIVFLRLNPDRYHHKMVLEDRIKILARIFQKYQSAQLNPLQV
jgi:hypothetical protein